MNKLLTAFLLFPLSSSLFAATLYVQWVDPTTPSAAYVPNYSAEYRINGGTATAITGLMAPSINQTISAVAGNTVEIRYRAINNVVPSSQLNGPWTSWYTAAPATTPGAQNAPTFVLFAY